MGKKPAPPQPSKQDQHLAAYTEMAEQCQREGKLQRASEYRNMAEVAQNSSWGPPVTCDLSGNVRKRGVRNVTTSHGK